VRQRGWQGVWVGTEKTYHPAKALSAQLRRKGSAENRRVDIDVYLLVKHGKVRLPPSARRYRLQLRVEQTHCKVDKGALFVLRLADANAPCHVSAKQLLEEPPLQDHPL